MEHKIAEKDYKHAYASLGQRLVAFIIDMLVAGALYKLISFFLPLDMTRDFFGISLGDLVKVLVTLGYFTILGIVTRGQSLGKMAMGIRVVSLRGDLGLSQIILRETCGRYVQNKFIILYIFALFTGKNQTLFDSFFDTAVVREEAMKDLYEF